MRSSSPSTGGRGAAARWLLLLDRRTKISTILFFTWFELRKMHAGHAIGVLWAVLMPLGQMLIYVYIFAIVLKVRFEVRPGVEGGPAEYIVYILSGLVPWLFIAAVINGGTGMVQQYASFIRQPNFPYRIIPSVVLLLGMPGHLASVAVIAVALTMVDLGFGGPAWSHLAAAYILAFFFLRGISTALGYLTMYAQDMRNIVSLGMAFLIYFSPVFYKPTQMPHQLRFILLMNPFSYVLSGFKFGFTGDPGTTLLGPENDLLVFAGLAVVGWGLERLVLGRIRSKGLDSVA
jgi:ABC-type polysaccharide/polyol phosphate export permease